MSLVFVVFWKSPQAFEVIKQFVDEPTALACMRQRQIAEDAYCAERGLPERGGYGCMAKKVASGKTMVDRTCVRCGTEFLAVLLKVEYGGGMYCTPTCRNAGQKKLRDMAARRQDGREAFRDDNRAKGDKPRW